MNQSIKPLLGDWLVHLLTQARETRLQAYTYPLQPGEAQKVEHVVPLGAIVRHLLASPERGTTVSSLWEFLRVHLLVATVPSRLDDQLTKAGLRQAMRKRAVNPS